MFDLRYGTEPFGARTGVQQVADGLIRLRPGRCNPREGLPYLGQNYLSLRTNVQLLAAELQLY